MPDPTPDAILAPRAAPADQRPPGPQGRDRAARARPLHRVVAAGASLAAQAAAVRARRARRLVGSGSGTSATSPAAAGRATPSTCATTTGRRRRTRRRSRSTRTPRTWSRRSSGSARTSWSSATGWAACSRSRRPSGCRSRAWCCSSPELPRELRPPARPHELREIPEVYGRSVIGWETLPEQLLRDHRDLTLADVLRIQHLLGQKPHEAGAARRADARAACPVDRRGVADVPRLVIGGGLDRTVTAGRRRSGSPSGSTRSTSRSARTRTTAWSSARRATSRSPTRSAGSSRPTGCSGSRRPSRGLWYHADRLRRHRRDAVAAFV